GGAHWQGRRSSARSGRNGAPARAHCGAGKMNAKAGAAKPKTAHSKTARRRSREFALQALYAWQIAQGSPSEIVEQVRGYEGFERANAELAETLVRGVAERAAELEGLIAPYLDRSFASLSPVERAILYIGTFE